MVLPINARYAPHHITVPPPPPPPTWPLTLPGALWRRAPRFPLWINLPSCRLWHRRYVPSTNISATRCRTGVLHLLLYSSPGNTIGISLNVSHCTTVGTARFITGACATHRLVSIVTVHLISSSCTANEVSSPIFGVVVFAVAYLYQYDTASCLPAAVTTHWWTPFNGNHLQWWAFVCPPPSLRAIYPMMDPLPVCLELVSSSAGLYLS